MDWDYNNKEAQHFEDFSDESFKTVSSLQNLEAS